MATAGPQVEEVLGERRKGVEVRYLQSFTKRHVRGATHSKWRGLPKHSRAALMEDSGSLLAAQDKPRTNIHCIVSKQF